MHNAGSLTGSVLLPQQDLSVRYVRHATVTWQDGHVAQVLAQPGEPPPDAPLIVPGFVDLHCHWPQGHVRGQFAGQLLPWLRESIWPAEATFADPAVARLRAKEFVDAALRAGTTAGLFFGPPFVNASAEFAAIAPLGWLEGPALMETGAPDALLRPVTAMLADLQARPTWQAGQVAVTPRFAPNVTAEGLLACGQAAETVHAPIQSHLSENLDEIAWVRELFPQARDYTHVYEVAQLLGPRTVMAHGIHLSDEELAVLAQTGTLIAHCPTSNEALHSGRMPLERLRAAGVQWVLATDVGAGPLLSQIDTIAAFLAVHAGHADVTAAEALCRSTAIPGRWLSQFDQCLQGLGTLAPGAPAHLVAFPRLGSASPLDDGENLLRALTLLPRDRRETLPSTVICWGERVV